MRRTRKPLLNILTVATIVYLIKGSTAERCENAPVVFKECPKQKSIVKIGSSITLKCSVSTPIDLCAWGNPQGRNVRPLATDQDYRLQNNNDRECNLKIVSVKKEDNGNWTCTPFLKGQSKPEHVVGEVIVAVAFSAPIISYTTQVNNKQKTHENPNTLSIEEGKELKVSCKVPNARPAAKIRWFVLNSNRERIQELTREAIERDPVKSDRDETLYDSYSEIRKVFTDRDNGKVIQCVADHLAVEQGRNLSAATLDVRFKPKFLKRGDKVFHIEGTKRSGTMKFRANPAPPENMSIQLRVGKNIIAMPNEDKGGFSVKFKKLENPSNDLYEITATVLRKMDEEVENTKIVLSVENDYGSQKVNVRFTSEALDTGGPLGTAGIIGIIITIIILIIVIVVIFFVTRRKKEEEPTDPEKQEQNHASTAALNPDNEQQKDGSVNPASATTEEKPKANGTVTENGKTQNLNDSINDSKGSTQSIPTMSKIDTPV